MSDDLKRARLLAAWVFVAIFAADRATAFVIADALSALGSVESLALLKGLLVGCVAGLVFVGFQIDWRRAPGLVSRVHAGSSLILLIVILAFSC